MGFEAQPSTSDTWTVESRARNWWAVVGFVAVVGGYAVAVIVGASARGYVALSDDAQIAMVGAAPALGVLGSLLALAGTRRPSLRALSWLVLGLGVVLVAVTLALLAMVVVALNELA